VINRKKYNLLVVDDEQGVIDLIENYLKLEGFQVFSTTNPMEALKMIEAHQIQVVISDILMPDKDGVQLVRDIKDFDGLIQVIMITGYVSMANIISVFRHGALNCIFKPFENIEVLKEEVEGAMLRLERISDVLRKRNLLEQS